MTTVISGPRVKVGTTHGDIRVTSGGKLLLIGYVAGTLTIAAGGYAMVLGMVERLVVERGGAAKHRGYCRGDAINEGVSSRSCGEPLSTGHCAGAQALEWIQRRRSAKDRRAVEGVNDAELQLLSPQTLHLRWVNLQVISDVCVPIPLRASVGEGEKRGNRRSVLTVDDRHHLVIDENLSVDRVHRRTISGSELHAFLHDFGDPLLVCVSPLLPFRFTCLKFSIPQRVFFWHSDFRTWDQVQ
ncbi:hypothetical protein ACQ86B_17550 [Mycolicibacterium aichiense]|uniref:hypothetical protein n=1 Tax=Mycolicibacterium aichiense TaxID=1799 RepID=UPI003D66EBA4